MRQEIFCYCDEDKKVHFISIEGALDINDILAEIVIKTARLKGKTPGDVLHSVSGKLQGMIKGG